MKPGPPPTPTNIRILRGNPGKRAMPKNDPQHGMPRAADVDDWWRVAPELRRPGLPTLIDTMPLAAYCCAYARWLEAEETLARIAANDPGMKGLLVKTTDGDLRRNPLIKLSADSAADMIRYAGKFGLTPSRARGWPQASAGNCRVAEVRRLTRLGLVDAVCFNLPVLGKFPCGRQDRGTAQVRRVAGRGGTTSWR